MYKIEISSAKDTDSIPIPFTIGGVSLVCKQCGYKWIDKRVEYYPKESPCRRFWEMELKDNPGERYFVCPKCSTKIDRLE